MPLAIARHSPNGPVLWAAAIGSGTTLAVAVIPQLRFAYESLELHVALESAQGVVALLLCYLTFGRLRATIRMRDLMLTMAFAAFASTNLLVSALPVAIEGETIGFTSWLAAGLRLVAALTLAGAAVSSDRELARRGLGRRVAAAAGAVIVGVVAFAAVADGTLSGVIDPELSPEASGHLLVTGHPVSVAIQVTSMVTMGVAAVAFVRKARRTGDELFRWLGAGATIGAFARLNYVLFPSLYTKWFYTGDLLRFGSYLFFLVGAAREIGAFWRSHAAMAVMDERRRVARELHDGLTQELSFLSSQLSSGAERGIPPEMVDHLAEAAQRAVVESRRAFDALADTGERRSLADVLRAAAEDVATREGVIVVLHVDGASPAATDLAAPLERIVREATVNAIRHGRASRVTVSLHATDRLLRVEVHDDGAGFDLDSVAGRGGFGLVSMKERATALGARFVIESQAGRGTTISLAVPVA